MQGRLSPIVGDKIQSFPWQNWRKELREFNDLNLSRVEWTLDLKKYYRNPLLRNPAVVKQHLRGINIDLSGLTSDAHMHGCFFTESAYKIKKRSLEKLERRIIEALSLFSNAYLVVPLVDESSLLHNRSRVNIVVGHYLQNQEFFQKSGVKVLFETDLGPEENLRFIKSLPENTFGINYDTGNSASLGYNVNEELMAYGDRVGNIHIKDRVFNGASCLLGTGDFDFDGFFDHAKNYLFDKCILQTARSLAGNHQEILLDQYTFLVNIMEKHGVYINNRE